MRGLSGVLLVAIVCWANAARAEVNYAIFPRPIEGAASTQPRHLINQPHAGSPSRPST